MLICSLLLRGDPPLTAGDLCCGGGEAEAAAAAGNARIFTPPTLVRRETTLLRTAWIRFALLLLTEAQQRTAAGGR